MPNRNLFEGVCAECGIKLLPGEGNWWHTGALLCDKHYAEWWARTEAILRPQQQPITKEKRPAMNEWFST
jgi:hypothetical protein